MVTKGREPKILPYLPSALISKEPVPSPPRGTEDLIPVGGDL